MARPQRRKRQAEDPLQEQISCKRSKSSRTVPRPLNFPPEFYDNLSKIWLTHRALRELDRRSEDIPRSELMAKPRLRRSERLAALANKSGPSLVSTAAAGGPDLSDLRGVC
jgi:hypothetical protein